MSATANPTTRARQRRPLIALVAAQILTGTGSWAALIAVQGDASYRLHQGALFLAAVAMAWGAPTVLLSVPVGRCIDAFGPRAVGVAGGVASGVVSVALAMSPPAGMLVALTALNGVARAFAQPAIDAMPSWLEQRTEHVTSSVWLGFGTTVPFVAGPASAAAAMVLWGIPGAFVVNAVAYLGAALIIAGLRTMRPVQAAADASPDTFGLAAAIANRGTRRVLGLTLVTWVSYGSFSALEILYVKNILHVPISTFAIIELFFGAGMLTGTITIATNRRLLRAGNVAALAAIAIGAAEVGYVGSANLLICFGGVFAWGVAAAIFGPACRLGLLTATTADQHGRAMALWRGTQSFGSVVPPLIAGLLAETVGLQSTLIGAASLVTLGGLVGLVGHHTPDQRPRDQSSHRHHEPSEEPEPLMKTQKKP